MTETSFSEKTNLRRSTEAIQRDASQVASGFAVIVGEVLWDCFVQRDRRSLGGAPLNVAWNLAGLGLDPLFVSAVGDDDLGREVLRKMNDFGLSTEGVSVLPGVPTGTVRVTLEQGEPKYDIVGDVAYDQIPTPDRPLEKYIADRIDQAKRERLPAILYHGTLACRDERSRRTVFGIRDAFDFEVFFDVNLRAPHYDRRTLDPMRRKAALIKLNLDELNEIDRDEAANRGDVAIDRGDPVGATVAAGKKFAAECESGSFAALLVTLGAEGALCFAPDRDQPLRVRSPKPEKMVDPVGAGDAFAAVTMHGVLTGRSMERTLPDAVAFASKVCGLSGATCADRDFYRLPSSKETD